MADKHPAQLTEINAIRAFIAGGNAKFTLVSQRTGARYTYKVARAKDTGTVFFVSVLAGPDNEADYVYAGIIPADKMLSADSIIVTKKSGYVRNSAPIVAIDFLLRNLNPLALPGEELREGIEFWHEGCCCRCGRTLTVPSSIAAGIGPECATKGAF